MMRYIKLVNFEINRFSKIYLSLLLITLVSQFAGVIIVTKSLLDDARDIMKEERLSEAAYIANYGGIDFNHIANSLLFVGPIALSAVALIFYIFLIWYRDWFGKNTFIYRLLMLPTSRLSIYLSKATSIFLMVLGLIAFQIIILPMENALFNSNVPQALLNEMSISTITIANPILSLIIPSTFTQFLLSYGIGLMIMSILFTAIMFERSFRIKGIIMGLLYCGIAAVLFLAPVLMEIGNFYFYPNELFGLMLAIGIILTGLSVWLGAWLLKNRVTV
ncbi:hypothetical protein ASG97_19030 [Bacillus sp. Soil745]|uniref:hypothetical protein n=1 Tax=Peribacillus frigoritolerans TaxID=450367 RepID=UPI00070A030B|nr:hypothetical protein [Peribacillus frigoritolerans]KRF47913.1 hypothetical protein ASG97_19030 [Bacillus sp. Soil745]MED3889818.1 hypothetical protein [Peribacillus frigoritolerans]PAW28248.1 hypothetical protein BKC07_14830 [Peribacillus simplex]